MAGGLSQLESWDPKPGQDTGGPFRAIPTSVPGVHISELLPITAKQMHHLALVRSINTKENDHGKGRYMMFTGRRQTPAQEFPQIGSVMAKALDGDKNALPGYIQVSSSTGGRSNDAAYLVRRLLVFELPVVSHRPIPLDLIPSMKSVTCYVMTSVNWRMTTFPFVVVLRRTHIHKAMSRLSN